jgi:hypothetical protein
MDPRLVEIMYHLPKLNYFTKGLMMLKIAGSLKNPTAFCLALYCFARQFIIDMFGIWTR